MNIITTSKGAYLANLLACLPSIDSIDKYQNLGLNVLQFDQYGMTNQLNTLTDVIMGLYTLVKKIHLNASKYDWRLSSWVLSKLPSADRKTPGHITPEDRQSRIRAINTRASIPFFSGKALVVRPAKLLALFSDSASKMTRSELLDTMDPDSIIGIHSASDEGAACIQAQPTAPDKCFSSLEFKVFIYLRLAIQISKEDVNCPLCTHCEGLSNLHLVNGCKNGEYVHRKHNIIMDQIKNYALQPIYLLT